MSSWTAASSDCSRPVNNYVHIKTADLYRPNARLIPERQGYQVLTPFGKLGYSQKNNALFAEFNTLQYRFMASFGSETKQIFTDTFKAVNSIFVSARMLATHFWKHEPPTDELRSQNFLDGISRHESVFWDSNTDDDIIRKQLQAVQVSLEEVTASCFKEPMSLLTRRWSWRRS